MGKTIEIRLSDAQHAALLFEAESAGRHLFDHCRHKLTEKFIVQAQYAKPELERLRVREAERVVAGRPPVIHDDNARMSRIEDALARLSEYVLGGQPTETQPEQPHDPIDVDSLVSAQFAEAEAQGLTEYVPDEAEQQLANSGVRPLSRRPIPFSVHSAPRHLRELG
jgi:hypothetical protein